MVLPPRGVLLEGLLVLPRGVLLERLLALPRETEG